MFDKIRHFAVNTIAPGSSMREHEFAVLHLSNFSSRDDWRRRGSGKGWATSEEEEEEEDGARIYVYTRQSDIIVV